MLAASGQIPISVDTPIDDGGYDTDEEGNDHDAGRQLLSVAGARDRAAVACGSLLKV